MAEVRGAKPLIVCKNRRRDRAEESSVRPGTQQESSARNRNDLDCWYHHRRCPLWYSRGGCKGRQGCSTLKKFETKWIYDSIMTFGVTKVAKMRLGAECRNFGVLFYAARNSNMMLMLMPMLIILIYPHSPPHPSGAVSCLR